MSPRLYLLPTLFAMTCACSERDLPLPPRSSPQVVRATPTPEAVAAPEASAAAAPSEAPKSPPPAPVASTTEGSLFDAQGHPLPQTETLPALDSPGFLTRMQLLLQAIDDNRPELADGSFFPVLAYEQVKDVANPARDHKYRLVAAYRRNIEEYHRKLKRQPHPLKLLGVETSRQPPRWMKPGSEGNKLGYHRMLRSQLTYIDATGAEHRLEITSLISWRGEWYVVHLNGFK